MTAAPGKALYEVNLSLNPDIEKPYLLHLQTHVEDMCKIEGFESAVISHRAHADENRDDDGKRLYTVTYVLTDRSAIDTYIRDHAAAMRKEMMDLFPEKDGQPQFTATRRVHTVISTV